MNKCPSYERSFASHEKAEYWDYEKNGDIKPRDVFSGTHVTFWFKCDKYPHSFNSAVNKISSEKTPMWCPYCATPSQKICPSDKDCDVCFQKSLSLRQKTKTYLFHRNLTCIYLCVVYCLLLLTFATMSEHEELCIIIYDT